MAKSFPSGSATDTPPTRNPSAADLPALNHTFLKNLKRNADTLLPLEANLQGAGNDIQSIYISSAFKGEGKTTVAAFF
jgi:Mrp family chromosome partitioning ATPase